MRDFDILENDDGFWGPVIDVNGERPTWLTGKIVCAVKTGSGWQDERTIDNNPAENWAWRHEWESDRRLNITHIALPADHPYYVSRPRGRIMPTEDLPHIVAAACRKGELIISMPRPARHHHILHAYHDLLDPDFKIDADSDLHIRGHEQGFLTSTGHYVDRVDGLAIAKFHNQIKEKQGNPTILFSEDMW